MFCNLTAPAPIAIRRGRDGPDTSVNTLGIRKTSFVDDIDVSLRLLVRSGNTSGGMMRATLW